MADAPNIWRGLLYGGVASCVAEGMTIPLDVLKVRMQLQGESGHGRQYKSAFDAVRQIYTKEGLGAFIKGIKPALLRQATYGSLRIGLYSPFKRVFGIHDGSVDQALTRKMGAGVCSGFLASAICNPTDLIKVRMQADGMRVNAPPSYRGVIHAAQTILEQEGLKGLYRGIGPTATRASVVAATELASYDEIKCFFLRNNWLSDGVALHFCTSLCAGFVATIASSPFDVVKSRVMSQPFDAKGKGLYYSGMLECFTKCFKSEGPLFVFNGFWPNYLNKGPTVVLFFLIYEQVRNGFEAILPPLSQE